MHKIKRLLLLPFSWLIAAVFLIEEALWDWTAALMSRQGAMRLVHFIEARISALSPRWALFAFLLPSLTIIPAKLIGLHAIASGHLLLGSGVFLLAKLLGVALFSRIFNLTRPALMQMPRFVRLYDAVMAYRNRLHAFLDAWAAYQSIRLRLASLSHRLRVMFKRKS